MKKKEYIQPLVESTILGTCVIMQTEGASTIINNTMTPIGGEGVD